MGGANVRNTPRVSTAPRVSKSVQPQRPVQADKMIPCALCDKKGCGFCGQTLTGWITITQCKKCTGNNTCKNCGDKRWVLFNSTKCYRHSNGENPGRGCKCKFIKLKDPKSGCRWDLPVRRRLTPGE